MNVSAKEAFKQCENDSHHQILDVRTSAEYSQGIPKGALCISLSDINENIDRLSNTDHLYILCHSGQRSKIAITQLQKYGFKHLYHINKGFVEWQKQNLPIEIPKIKNDDIRYNRHHQLSDFGRKGQEKLNQSHVLLIGAGGLGSSSALYLAAAGVGHITIVDDDIVSLSNLQRQIIHTTDGIGSLKVDSAQSALVALNPEIKITAISNRLNSKNAQELISQVDVVIDGSDNLATRYIVNDICLQQQKPLVYASVFQYEAQLTVFDFRIDDTPCLRCLFPQTEGYEPENCSTVGVLGVVPGLAGIMQATETIKLITELGETLLSKLLIIDVKDNSFRTIKYKKNDACQHVNS